MAMHTLRLLPVLASLIFCACTSVDWHKEGADATAVANDWASCRRVAELQTPRFPPNLSTGAIAGPSGVIIPMPGMESQSPQRLADVQLSTQKCMRDQGYELIPVSK